METVIFMHYILSFQLIFFYLIIEKFFTDYNRYIRITFLLNIYAHYANQRLVYKKS